VGEVDKILSQTPTEIDHAQALEARRCRILADCSVTSGGHGRAANEPPVSSWQSKHAQPRSSAHNGAMESLPYLNYAKISPRGMGDARGLIHNCRGTRGLAAPAIG
jgi:hypothetical protein